VLSSQVSGENHPGQDPETRALRAQLHRDLNTEQAELLAEKKARLRYVLDRGIEATLPDAPHTGSYAIDCTEVESWAHQHRRQPRRPELYPDPDASWNGKGEGWFGYWLHGVVRVGEVGGPDVPCFIERLELTAANADVRFAGLELVERMVSDNDLADTAAGHDLRPRRDILADRAYTSETRQADDWDWAAVRPRLRLRARPDHYQLGQLRQKTTSGALVIDGQPASPRMPAHLRDIPESGVAATRQELDTYEALIDQRRPWMLYALGGRADDGSWDFGCRAIAAFGKVRCDLKPTSMNKPPTASRLTADPTLFNPRRRTKDLHAICVQNSARTPASDLPFWQKDLHGSREWRESWNRRNRVEGLFGNIRTTPPRTSPEAASVSWAWRRSR
jgi:hypothetical protein